MAVTCNTGMFARGLTVFLALSAGVVAWRGPAVADEPKPQVVNCADAAAAPAGADPWSGTCGVYLPDGSELHRIARKPPPEDFLKPVNVLIVGEVHDDPLHHRLQAALLEAFAAFKKSPPAVVMEHLRPSQADALKRYVAGIDRTKPDFWKAAAAGLGPALSWEKTGWPAWSMFEPIAEAAFKLGSAISAGDPARALVRDVARKGLGVLDQARRTELGLDVPLPSDLHEALLAELEANHCNLMPRSAFGTMADAQRLRDATLAASVVAAAKAHGSAVLFTGNGHVRTDRGAASYIENTAPQDVVATVTIVEAPPGNHDPRSLMPKSPDGGFAADLMIVTPRINRPDPCEKMRARFKKKP